MSLVRELHHRLREALRRELRTENALVRDDGPERESRADRPERDAAVEQGTEIPDQPMGVPPGPTDGDEELPGLPRDDPSRG